MKGKKARVNFSSDPRHSLVSSSTQKATAIIYLVKIRGEIKKASLNLREVEAYSSCFNQAVDEPDYRAEIHPISAAI